MPHHEDQTKQARRDLARLGEQSEKLLGAGPARPEEDDAHEPAVIWGKRIGRTAGLVALVWLAWHLVTTYALHP